MKKVCHIVLLITACLAVSHTYAQNPSEQPPKFVDPPLQQYTIGVPITPLPPNYRNGSAPVPNNIYGEVITYAGNGSAALVNGINKLSASFNKPQDVQMGPDGYLYVADGGNHVIRRISPLGVVSTFAGTGASGSADGRANVAQFVQPTRMVFDKDGNLFVTDQADHTIRKITPAGIVSTYAGTPGTHGLSNNIMYAPIGITIDATGYVMLVADSYNSRIRQVHDGYVEPYAGGGINDPSNITGDGTGPEAVVPFPQGIVTALNGNFYMTNASTLRIMTPGPNVRTIAGSLKLPGIIDGQGPSAKFGSPGGLTIDKFGFMYVSDEDFIRRITPDINVTTIAGGTGSANGVGLNAKFNNPAGLCSDNKGNLYVADTDNNLIRRISMTGFLLIGALPGGLVFDPRTGTISGTPTTETNPRGPTRVTVVGYNIYGSRAYNVEIQVNKAIRNQQVITFPPLPTTKKEGDLDFNPGATVVPSSDVTATYLYYTSSDENIVSIADGKIHILQGGEVIITAHSDATPFYDAAVPKSQPFKVAFVPIHYEYPTITPKPAPVIMPLDSTGTDTVTVAKVATVVADDAGQQPMVVKIANNIFTCADIGPQQVMVSAGYGPDPADPLNAQFNTPSGIAYDNLTKKIYITDLANRAVRQIGTDGKVTTFAGGVAAGNVDGLGKNARFGVALFSATTDAQGNLYVCDVANYNIRKISPQGLVTTFAYDALTEFNDTDPYEERAIAVDGAGYVYLAYPTRIVKISPDGQSVTPFAGNLTAKNVNNDGIGTAAYFSGITGMSFDKNGNLIVCSSDNDDIRSVRSITPAGEVTTLVRKNDFLMRFRSVVTASDGTIYVGASNSKIYKLTPASPQYTFTIFAGGAAGYKDGTGTAAQFTDPHSLTIDADDNIYVADADNHLIRKVSPTGVVTTIAGNNSSGYVDNASLSNALKVPIQVIITNPIKVAKHDDVEIKVSGNCALTLKDYRAEVNATSPCPSPFNMVQLPAAGTPIADGQDVTVKITVTDNLDPHDKAVLEFKVKVVKAPDPVITIAHDTGVPCDGTAITYRATVLYGGDHPVFKWLVNGEVQTVADSIFTSTTLKNNDVISCTVTNTDGVSPGCIPAFATSNADVLQTQPSTVNTIRITSSINGPVCPGTSLTFNAIATVKAGSTPQYQWTVNGQNMNNNSSTFTTSQLTDDDVVICMLSSGGVCVINPVFQSNAIVVVVRTETECELTKYNTFTPNGDGINDTWAIPNLINYPTCTVNIYTRNGRLVYHSTGYGKPWDGNYSGAALPVGTYYYVIDTKTGQPPVSGAVTILR